MRNKLSNFLATRLSGAALWSNVSCRIILNIVAKTVSSSVQFRPFPVYPGWHWHTCDPRVFMHVAFTWQEWFPLQSSISEKPFCTLFLSTNVFLVVLESFQMVRKNLHFFVFNELDFWNVHVIRQMETMGNITARGFITRLYSATVPTDSFMEKIY